MYKKLLKIQNIQSILMIKQQHTSLKNALGKEEVEQYFSKMFEDQSNTQCFQCSKKSKQWADRSHAIFLCLDCAALYKQMKWAVDIKSIGLDLWSKKELQVLSLGGNRRFKQFLAHYELDKVNYKNKLKTKAAQYYRILLLQQVNDRQPPEPPIKQIGQQTIKDQIPITDMSPDEIFQYTKQKAFMFGSKTKQFGSKAYSKIQHKISSGQMKQDVKKAATQVKTKAKALWQFAVSKVKQINKGKQNQDKKPEPQL